MVDSSCSTLRVTASHGRLLRYCPLGATIVAWVALKAGMGYCMRTALVVMAIAALQHWL